MWFKKNLFNIILVAIVVVLVFYPPAKIWVLQRLMDTGVMNVKPEESPGAVAAPMSFKNNSSNVLSTDQLKGKVVFINFWATWCPPCLAEMPSLQRLYNKYKDNPNVAFLFVDADGNLEKSMSFLQSKSYNLPLYVMEGNADPNLYRGTLPTTIILDKSGHVALNHSGAGRYDNSHIYEMIEKQIQTP